jgi:thiamine-monophosphate kinase
VKLDELGEFGLIERIAARVSPGADVTIGIGDDAAAVVPTPGLLILTTSDMLVEGIHFDLAYCDPLTLGRKSLAVNLSDIAAMGGKPRWFLLSLALPRELHCEFLDSFIDGMLQLAGEFDVTLIGGDTCASGAGVVISITVLGEQRSELVVQRRGARPGDLIFVTGTLGDASLGLELLRHGKRENLPIKRHLDPSPRVREGAALACAGLPTAMIDLSDGLLADLGHILDNSGVGARLEVGRLPLSGSFLEYSATLPGDPLLFPLAGGEDYELLFTAPASKDTAVREILAQLSTQVTVIGAITSAIGITAFAPDGADYSALRRGYNHFA